MRKAATLLLVLSAVSGARAASFIPQASFNLAGSTVIGMDQDAAGNLYMLSLAPGASVVPGNSAPYTVTSYQAPSMTPELSFSVSITTPLAFAVEANGTVDIVDAGNGLTLSRFNNAGTLLSQTSRIQPYGANYYTGAIDKAKSAFYVSYKSAVTQATGDFSFKILYYVGAVTKYSFTGQTQNTFDLPGRTSISTTCYTPSLMAVDAQSTLWIADQVCDQVLTYNTAGTLGQDFPLVYTAYPRGIWPAPLGNVFVTESVCDSIACPRLETYEYGGGGALQASFAADSMLGQSWDSRTLYMASTSGTTLQRFILDSAPTAPVPTGLQGSVTQHAATANLSWQAAGDADGDAILYSVYVGPSANQLAFAGSTTQTSFVTAPLNFGANYFWEVAAQDSYMSLPMLTSTSAIDAFTLNFQNSPPGAFSVVSGTGTAVTRSTAATFGWTAAIDPDGDPVTYTVTLQAAGSSATVVTTAANSLVVNGLAFGTPVTWSVKACDPYNACTTMTGGAQTYEPVFENLPPPAPAIAGGTGSLSEHTLAPQATLSWAASIDPDGDPVNYRLYVGTSASALALAQDSAQTSYTLAGMPFGKTYYWQVSAYDPYGGVGATPAQSIVAQLQNNPPQPFTALTGTAAVATRGASQLLSWTPAVDPDGDVVTYEVDASTNPAALAAVQTSTATSYILNFQIGTTYYWQVIARDGFGGATPSGLQTFLPVFRNSSPTVPANQTKTGTIAYHGFNPSLSFFWGSSTDPDGDAFGYSVSYGTNSSQLVTVSSAPLGYTLSNLPLNQAIYYEITATDIYGAASPSPVNWVYFQFTNSPPGPFDVLGTTGTIYTRQTSANLSWTVSTDPDGDPVSYGVLIGTVPAALSLMTTTTKNSAVLPNLAYGTTYYWRVDAYDGFGGTTTVNEGVQSLLYVFYDPTPSAIVYTSTSSSYSQHTSSPSVILSWQPSTNAAGDSLTYRLDMQISTSAWPSTQMGTQTGLTLPVVFETTYTWRAVASDPYGGTSTGVWMSFIVHLANQPPNPIVYSSPSMLVTRSTSTGLSWQSTGDPDGDPTSYSFFLSTNPSAQYLVMQGTQIVYTLSYQFGLTYYWRVSAVDSFGARTDGAVQTFQPVFENTPPPAPSVVASTGTIFEHALTAQVPLSWSATQDPDGDPTNYVLSVGTSATSLVLVQSSTQTSYAVSSPRFGATYYWQVSAQNPYGGASTTTLQFATPVFQNNPPGAFGVTLGTGTLISRTTTQLLAWDVATDPDGDAVSYALSISTNPARLPVVQTSTATTYTLAFAYGTTYYWSVSAFDGFGGTTTITAGTQTFLPLFLDHAPQAVQLTPQPVITTMRGTATISWQQVTNAEGDPVSYTVLFGDSLGNLHPFAEITPSSTGGSALQSVRILDALPQAQTQIVGNTITLTLTGLAYYRTYHIQIQAVDPFGGTSMSNVQAFTLGALNGFPATYNYPNPFSPARGGTNIVFNAPPSGYAHATVSVYSEQGDLLFKQDYSNIAPGISQVPFPGRDRFGRPFSNGSYPCRVRFDGPDDRATFYFLVVK